MELKNYKINLPKQVKWIIENIQAAGFEAYAVGGCVRDSILGRIPNDWDITTSAKPEEVKKIFTRTIDTGIQHGTVTVMIEKEGYEITTYRIDGEYEDNRHPKEVNFTGNLLEDLKRRDFTINAMAYNEKDGLVDVFGGVEDIQRKIIRCVGDPLERFSEDALRMMRAIRFSAQLGYEIDEKTSEAIGVLAQNISYVSAERIQVELVKLLVSDHPDYLRKAYETKLTRYFMHEFDLCMETKQNHPHHIFSVGEHILHSINAIEADKVLRLTMLFHDIGKPQTLSIDEDGTTHNYGHPAKSKTMTYEILRRLRFDNDTIQKVTNLVYYHDYRMIPEQKYVRRAIHKVGVEGFPMLLKVQLADIAAQSDYQREEKIEKINQITALYQEIIDKQQPLNLKDLAITGKDLMEIGIPKGKMIGEVLNQLLEHILDVPEDNKREILLSMAGKIEPKNES